MAQLCHRQREGVSWAAQKKICKRRVYIHGGQAASRIFFRLYYYVLAAHTFVHTPADAATGNLLLCRRRPHCAHMELASVVLQSGQEEMAPLTCVDCMYQVLVTHDHDYVLDLLLDSGKTAEIGKK